MSERKRIYGEGLVRQRKDGRWEFRIRLAPGARPFVLYARTRPDLLRKLAEEKARNGGSLKERSRLTVRSYLADFLENDVVPNLAPQTIAAYRTWIGHALPIIGGMQLREVDARVVDKLYSTLRREKRGACTIAKVHAVLTRAWNLAVRKEFVQRNPFNQVEPPSYETPEVRYLTVDESQRLLEIASTTRWYPLIALLLATGMRIGEAAGLRWRDIDWDRNRISIRVGQTDVDGQIEAKRTKTKKSRRYIDVDAKTMQIMAVHRKNMLRDGHSSHTVFVGPDGGVLRRANFRKRDWIPLVAAAGLEGVTPHDLRHTHATMLLTAGENPKVVSERLGHESIKITLDTYSHVIPAIHRGAADRIGELLYLDGEPSPARRGTLGP